MLYSTFGYLSKLSKKKFKCCALVLLTTENVKGLILIISLLILFGQILVELVGSRDILRNNSSKTEGCADFLESHVEFVVFWSLVQYIC